MDSFADVVLAAVVVSANVAEFAVGVAVFVVLSLVLLLTVASFAQIAAGYHHTPKAQSSLAVVSFHS